MRIGITGHQKLRRSSDWDWVHSETRKVLFNCAPPLIGISSLAAGADQLFAEAVLESGGTLEAVIPFADYETTFSEPEDRNTYQTLVASASNVEVLARMGSDQESYLMAGKRVVERADVLLAIWDGLPAVGLGGTADVVQYARDQGRKLIHLNPSTREITESE